MRTLPLPPAPLPKRERGVFFKKLNARRYPAIVLITVVVFVLIGLRPRYNEGQRDLLFPRNSLA
jgi:hypothetical protein